MDSILPLTKKLTITDKNMGVYQKEDGFWFWVKINCDVVVNALKQGNVCNYPLLCFDHNWEYLDLMGFKENNNILQSD